VMPSIEWLPVDVEILAALDEMATRLGRAGLQVKEVQPEALGDMRDYYGLYISVMSALSNTGRPESHRRQEAEEIRGSTDAFDSLAWADGLVASASDYVIWFGAREYYRAVFRAFFDDWDILLAPCNFVNAFPHTDAPWPERRLDVNGQAVHYALQSVYASLCNFSGQPGTAVPVGLTRSGLPIGLQAVGPYLKDRTPIRFAELAAREFGGFQRPPGYNAD
jgi:amidase